jgi:hypothetical protein
VTDRLKSEQFADRETTDYLFSHGVNYVKRNVMQSKAVTVLLLFLIASGCSTVPVREFRTLRRRQQDASSNSNSRVNADSRLFAATAILLATGLLERNGVAFRGWNP